MEIYIELLSEGDAKALFDFEQKNRTYFETLVPSRGDDYYMFENFNRVLANLLQEQREGTSFFHLIKDADKKIIGRINLVDIDQKSRVGHIGYRIGEGYLGKGVATIALKKLLNVAVSEYQVTELLASTTSNNIGSQKVLKKNGFQLISVEENKIEIHGIKLDFLNYVWKQR